MIYRKRGSTRTAIRAVVEDDEQPDQATPTPVENSNAEANEEE